MSNNKNYNRYTLSIDTIRDLSIDDIISLYRQGYRLENIESDVAYQSSSNIESMVYGTSCTGTITLDRSNTIASGYDSYAIDYAYAQKVMPTSKCLKNVILSLSRVLDVDMYVEIRRNDPYTNLPIGNPQDGGYLGKYTIPYTSISQYPTFQEITVPLDIELIDSDITNGIWIVACMYNYDPNYPGMEVYSHIKGGEAGTTAEHYAFKFGNNPWIVDNTWSFWFKTNKQTYSIPTPVLTTITITPTSTSINVEATQQLTAVCKDQNTATMTCPTLTWVSSNTSKATVNSSGLVTGVAAGSANITASASGVTSNASAITVTSPSQVLTTITISPTTPSINTGGVVQLTAVCKDLSDVTMTCPTLAWVSSNTSKATVNPSSGLVTGVAAGSANITASASGVTSNASTVTVTGTVSILTSIVVSPTSASIAIGETRQLTAVCKDQNTATMTCPTLTWSSSNTSKATVNSSSGLVTGVAEGTTNVTASANDITSNASAITVTTTPPPSAGGGMMMMVAVAAIGAFLLLKKPPALTKV